MLEIGELAKDWLAGQPAACNGRELAKHMEDLERSIDAGDLLNAATGGALEAGGPLAAT